MTVRQTDLESVVVQDMELPEEKLIQVDLLCLRKQQARERKTSDPNIKRS